MKISATPPPAFSTPGPSLPDKLETAFLAEMLKHMSPSQDGPFSGGAGEQQFGSWLTEARAEALAARIDLKLGSVTGNTHD